MSSNLTSMKKLLAKHPKAERVIQVRVMAPDGNWLLFEGPTTKRAAAKVFQTVLAAEDEAMPKRSGAT